MVATVVPAPELLPEMLPTARLADTGRPRPAVREDLKRIDDRRSALTVAGAWAQSLGVLAAAALIGRWWAYLVAFFLLGRGFVLLNILGHEAVHRLLFRRKALNDTIGRWLLSYPGWSAFDLYRRSHMAHHRDELGPDEPDLGLYSGYPITRRSLRRKLTRDAVGISGWKNLAPLLKALRSRTGRPVAARIVGVQLAIWAGTWAVSGRWWLYLVLWFVPWMTVWRVLNRLRAIAEHAGLERSDDKRRTTHVVRQHPLARFWMVPYNTGYHLAHHVDAGIPWRKLPALQRELEDAGWVAPGLEYPSYTALWRALSGR